MLRAVDVSKLVAAPYGWKRRVNNETMEMNAIMERNDRVIPTSKYIMQLGLPARQQREALETLALVEALFDLFFARAEPARVAKRDQGRGELAGIKDP